MKAQYILEALDAMRNAEQVLLGIGTDSNMDAYFKLMDARCALLVHSGVRDVEVPVEKAES